MRQSFFFELGFNFFAVGDADALSTDHVRGRGAGAGRLQNLWPIGT